MVGSSDQTSTLISTDSDPDLDALWAAEDEDADRLEASAASEGCSVEELRLSITTDLYD
jgi:hypothetical protein